MRKFLEFAEQAFTVLSLLHYSSAILVVVLIEGQATEPTEYPIIQRIFILIYLITLFLLAIRWKRILYIISKDWCIWTLAGLALVSVVWSEAPLLTLSRSIALIFTTLFGVYFATRYSLKQQLYLLAWTFGIAVVLSCLFVVALPRYGIMTGIHNGAFRGIYSHKNVLGKIMILSTTVFFILARSTAEKRWLLWLIFGLSIILAILSKSTTSQLNLITLSLVFFIFQTLRLRFAVKIVALITLTIISASLSVWIADNLDFVFSSFGKNPTLTGRTDLWDIVLQKIQERPLLGYGFSGFWLGMSGESSIVWIATRFEAPNGHNGFLDLSLDLGLVGLSIYLFRFITSFFRALSLISVIAEPEVLWPGIYLTYILLANVSESTLLGQNSLFWVLQVSVILSILQPIELETNMLAAMDEQEETLSNHLVG